MPENTKDTVEKLLGATIQHGALSNRIYLMKIDDAPETELIPAVYELAETNGYTKIFAKVPAGRAQAFLSAGYRKEAHVPGFFQGEEDAMFLGYYPDPARAEEANRDELEQIVELAGKKRGKGTAGKPPPVDVVLRRCGEEEVHEMSKVYRDVFPSYPFPIHDPAYLRKTMGTHIVYFGAERNSKLIALSSAEMDEKARNVEMTDFATLPDARGGGLAVHLLSKMEDAMRQRGILTAYTIARAVSAGMNITFAKLAYTYGGRLVNNTNISGNIESMNVWYKPL